jgi:hemerythrin HHE cation binding domain-containing protein
MTTTPEHAHRNGPRPLCLPGQADAPAGPVDLSMMYLMHHAFRRDLAAFAAAVPRTPPTEVATWWALLRRWELFAEVLHHHHRGEDAWLWPALLERADGAEREILEAMEAEHHEIDPLLAACLAGLRRLARGGAGTDDRAALAVRLAATRESLGRHLAHEERDALRILQRHLTQTEWQAMEVRFAEGVRACRLVALVPWLVHELPPEVRADLLAGAPVAHRALWRLTHRRFERSERHTFRFAGERRAGDRSQ